MRRRTPEERYKDNTRKQQRKLEDFVEHEIEWSELLLRLYRIKKKDMPDDEYRASAFFINKEYLRKPGSLALLYKVYEGCYRDLPEITKENSFDILRFRFRMYAVTLEKGGY